MEDIICFHYNYIPYLNDVEMWGKIDDNLYYRGANLFFNEYIMKLNISPLLFKLLLNVNSVWIITRK
jgi:hypothetical protein